MAAVLLAAGQSQRFGETDKMMADYRGKPLFAHAMEAVAALPFAELVAVVRPISLAPVLHRKLERRGFTLLVNDAPEEGLAGSIVRAISHVAQNPRYRGALICLADMPAVPPSHLTKICEAAVDIRSVIASTDGFSPCPPSFIGRKHFNELLALRGDQGARALLSRGILIETNGPVLRDIDVPEDI